MFLSIDTDYPEARKIQKVIPVLESDGIIIYPTGGVYGLGCDIFSAKAVERICWIRKLKPAKAHLTFICKDQKQVAQFAKPIDNTIFKLMKRNWPGPFTFILPANNSVPRLFKNKKKTIGVRIPANAIAQAILEELDRPILSLSLKTEDDFFEYPTDPFEIYEKFDAVVDIVIDGGLGKVIPSTIVDCTKGDIEITREGARELEW